MVASLAAFILQVLSNPFRPLPAHCTRHVVDPRPVPLVMVFLLPVFVVDTIKLSHRFAGPIFSLRRAMREIVQGKPPRKLKFRTARFLARPGRRLQRDAAAAAALDEDVDHATTDEEQLVGAKE